MANDYIRDVLTGRVVQVGTTGGDEFDIISDGRINEGGSISVVEGTTSVTDVNTTYSESSEVSFRTYGVNRIGAGGALKTMDGRDDPFFTLFSMRFSRGMFDSPYSLILGHKNSKDAFGHFVLYFFRIKKKLEKVGKADAERVTESTGLPTRVHQQMRKLKEKHGDENVDVTLVDLGNRKTGSATGRETSMLNKIFKKLGIIPSGNSRSYKPPKSK